MTKTFIRTCKDLYCTQSRKVSFYWIQNILKFWHRQCPSKSRDEVNCTHERFVESGGKHCEVRASALKVTRERHA